MLSSSVLGMKNLADFSTSVIALISRGTWICGLHVVAALQTAIRANANSRHYALLVSNIDSTNVWSLNTHTGFSDYEAKLIFADELSCHAKSSNRNGTGYGC